MLASCRCIQCYKLLAYSFSLPVNDLPHCFSSALMKLAFTAPWLWDLAWINIFYCIYMCIYWMPLSSSVTSWSLFVSFPCLHISAGLWFQNDDANLCLFFENGNGLMANKTPGLLFTLGKEVLSLPPVFKLSAFKVNFPFCAILLANLQVHWRCAHLFCLVLLCRPQLS